MITKRTHLASFAGERSEWEALALHFTRTGEVRLAQTIRNGIANQEHRVATWDPAALRRVKHPTDVFGLRFREGSIAKVLLGAWYVEDGAMFLAIYDPDKKKKPDVKLAEAIERYKQKFGSSPALCLTSSADAMELAGRTELPVRAVSYIGRHTFYVGVESVEELAVSA